jgi:hypothetical protein
MAAGEDGDVLEHGLAAVAEAGGLDGGDLQGAAHFVDDEGSEGFAVDVFGDDEQGASGLRHLLKDGEEVLHGADLLLVEQDEGAVEDDFHALGVR